MNVLNNTINRINFLILAVNEKIRNIPPAEMEAKPNPIKWSKKEILGHLCDSAVNNLSRFIRAQFEPEPFKVVPYSQDEWVRKNDYQNMKTEKILELWTSLNSQIVNVIIKMPEDKLGVICDAGEAVFRESNVQPNLLGLIEDYLVHMEYHLKQVLGKL
jgi:hypothetical protein